MKWIDKYGNEIVPSYFNLNDGDSVYVGAIQPKDQGLDKGGLVDEKLIVSVSAGLINIDTKSKITHLVHFTVKEYYKERKEKWFPDADTIIAEACLTYLSFDIFQKHQALSYRQ